MRPFLKERPHDNEQHEGEDPDGGPGADEVRGPGLREAEWHIGEQDGEKVREERREGGCEEEEVAAGEGGGEGGKGRCWGREEDCGRGLRGFGEVVVGG